MTGIEPFINQQYAKDSPEGGLLGLMQSDDADYWKMQLVDKLTNTPKLVCVSPLTNIDVASDLPGMTVSKHRRIDATTMDLYHAFLDCTP